MDNVLALPDNANSCTACCHWQFGYFTLVPRTSLPSSRIIPHSYLHLYPTNNRRLGEQKDHKRHSQDEALAGKGTQAGANAFARRPWLSLETSERPSANRELSGAAQDPNQAEVPQSRDLSYRFWEESELRRLIEMRSGGAKWSAIAKAFPDHTSEAVKQTYHKRRHAEEQKIEEEKASDKAAKKD
ncbi:hypothetical protein DER46DRAFT_655632 [Fusarium sp. MPI-SDFR-AT-0072]|nr:hypothetical protein DER46DRAFT_655632 [Fusarium sp. MPI-SDFR-AT-0072]